MLLERLICLLPHSVDDEWCSLSDAKMSCSGISIPRSRSVDWDNDDTVVLDGACGATIRWDGFVAVLTLG